jgi:hypothetical protein
MKDKAKVFIEPPIKHRGKNRGMPRAIVPSPMKGLWSDMEESFAGMVVDGMPQAEAFRKAGYKAGSHMDATRLWRSERIQGLAKAILKARRETAAVSLPEVTHMMQRIYAGALAAEDYSPAHNAAFSLARLYGMVVDRAQIEHIRRPARNPDAPAEQDMGSWIASLPSLEPSSPKPLISLDNQGSSLEPQGSDGMIVPARQIENGAPTEPVTGTPNAGALAGPGKPFGYTELYPEVAEMIKEDATEPDTPPGPVSKKVPRRKKRVARKKGAKRAKKLPTAKQLFG